MKGNLENLSAKELDKLIWREQCKISLIQVKIDKLKKLLKEKSINN